MLVKAICVSPVDEIAARLSSEIKNLHNVGPSDL